MSFSWEFVFAFLLGAEAMSSLLASGCPTGWKTWYNACYFIDPNPVTYQDAIRVCEEMGSSLVVPKSRDENDVILAMVKKRQAAAQSKVIAAWINCYRESPKADFKCSGEKESMTYTYWADNQPADKRNCVHFWSGGYGRWLTATCDKYIRHVAVCKMANIPRLRCATADASGRFDL